MAAFFFRLHKIKGKEENENKRVKEKRFFLFDQKKAKCFLSFDYLLWKVNLLDKFDGTHSKF
jgi:hypothetical protein